MPKVLLIRPKRTPSDGRVVMPLGIMSLAAYTRKYGVTPTLLDQEITDITPDMLRGYDVYGLSVSMKQQETAAADLAATIIQQQGPDARIVFGGNQATFSEQGFPTVAGQGEAGFIEYCGLHDVKPPGIEYLPLAAYDLLDVEKYFAVGRGENVYSPHRRVLQYETSRGCPFSCGFCSTKRFWGRWRGKSVTKILSELVTLRACYDMTEVNIVDPNLLADKQRALDLFKEWPTWLPGVAWSNPGGIWIGGLTAELLTHMRAAGCYQLTFPIETTNAACLKRYNLRKVDPEYAEIMALHCKQLGIAIHGFFIAGMQGQTLEDTRADLEFARRLDFESVSVNLLTAFPGTDITSGNTGYRTSRDKHLETAVAKMTRAYNRATVFRHPVRYLRKYWPWW